MDKWVILELDGDLETSGFRTTLEIRSENELHSLKVKGYLPPVLEMAVELKRHWQQTYRSLGMPQRIKGKKIIHKGSINQRIGECRRSASQLRQLFLNWLNSESFQSIDRRLREELNRQENIRFLIRTDDPNLQKLPWHEWDFFDRYPNAEVALSSPEYEAVRSQPATAIKTTTQNRVNILAILGNRQGINLETDRQSLENLPNANVEFLVEPDRTQLTDRLWENPWDILFFAGHSQTEGETGRIYINPTDSLTIEELKYGLKKAIDRGLQLAIFNSCDGLGLVWKLKELHIPQTIVMREPVPDGVAEAFLKYFLEGFSTGKPLYLAQRQARERLQALEDRFPCASWLPVLYQNHIAQPPDWQTLQGYSHPPTPTQNSPKLPPKRPTPSRSFVLQMSLAATLFVMGLRFVGVLQPWELTAFDRLMRQRPPEAIDSRILVVEITQEDVNNLGGYPITDGTLTQTIDALQANKPAAIGIDLHRYQPRGEGRQEFLAQFQQHSNLFAVCAFDNADRDYAPPPEFSPQQRITHMGFSNFPMDSQRAISSPSRGNLPNNIASPVENCTIRRQLLSYAPELAATPSSCQTPYSLSFQLAYRFLSQTGVEPLQVTENDNWQFGSIEFPPLSTRFGGYQNLDGMSSQLMLNYRAATPGQRVSLQQVLNGTVNVDWVKNRIVLVGYTAPVARDSFETPEGKMPGVWIHAHMVSQLVSAVLEKRSLLWVLPQWRNLQWGDGAWVLAWSMVGGFLVTRWRSRSLVWLGLAIVAMLWSMYQISLMVLNVGGWLPLIPTVLSLFLTAGAIVIFSRQER